MIPVLLVQSAFTGQNIFEIYVLFKREKLHYRSHCFTKYSRFNIQGKGKDLRSIG